VSDIGRHLVCGGMRQAARMIEPKEQVGEKWRSLEAEQAESGQSVAAVYKRSRNFNLTSRS